MLIGVVGKPSVGKSTFFKAATMAEVEIANYPFTTIKPNHGIGFVRVKRVDKELGRIATPRIGYVDGDFRFVPIDMIDVAGLVPGAHEGAGLGSQFLNDLNQADALIHVIDVSGSTNEKGENVEPLSYDPVNDVKFLEIELDKWYERIMKSAWDKFARTVKQTKQELYKAIAKQMSGVGVDEDLAKQALKDLKLSENIEQWEENSLYELAKYFRIHTKPMIIAANKADVPGAMENVRKLQDNFPEYTIVPCSAESELALKEAAKKNLIKYVPGENEFEIIGNLNEKQIQALKFIKENILEKIGSTGLQEVIDKVVFEIMDLIAIFPGGVSKLEDSEGRVLPDCFLLKNGSTALDFAYKIHSDLGNSFIRAIDVRTKMAVGKEHKIKHRDVLEIVSGK